MRGKRSGATGGTSACLLLRNYYRLGQILIDKVAIGNGMVSKYHFEFEQYPRFLEVLNSGQGVIMIGAHVAQLGDRCAVFRRLRQKDQHRYVRCRAPTHQGVA